MVNVMYVAPSRREYLTALSANLPQEQTICSICLQPTVPKEDVASKCAHDRVEHSVIVHDNHVLGYKCIQVWLREHNSCPICRKELFPQQLQHEKPPPIDSEGVRHLGPIRIHTNYWQLSTQEQELVDLRWQQIYETESQEDSLAERDLELDELSDIEIEQGSIAANEITLSEVCAKFGEAIKWTMLAFWKAWKRDISKVWPQVNGT